MNIMNKITVQHRTLRDILKVNSGQKFHNFFIEYAIKQYQFICRKQGTELGKALILGSSEAEALIFKKFPFKKILLTSLNPPTKKILEIIKGDSRITYQRQNIEKLSPASKSYDFVFCKEALHHLPRPILGLYEMLRVCKHAVIIIEPYKTLIGRILELFNLSSIYETNQKGNIKFRNNFVYRWDKNQLRNILNSYYLKSGYHLNLTLCWLSNKYGNNSFVIKYLLGFIGWLLSFIPYNRGNYMTALILPGLDIPQDPFAL